MFKHIFVSTDGTPQSARAVKAGAGLANSLGATLTLFHASRTYKSHYYPDAGGIAWPPQKQYLQDSSANADAVLTTASALAQKQGVSADKMHAYSDSPAEAIIASARKAKADVIVMASHGRKGIDKLLLGSETQKVLAHTKLPVLVVR